MAHKITAVDGDLGKLLHESYSEKYCRGYIKVDGIILPESYNNFAEAIDNFEVRDDDIWLCTFPKTGTTWTQEMVWCIANDLDFERAKVPLEDRFPFFEICGIVNFEAMQRNHPEIRFPKIHAESISFIKNLRSPRFIKTHLPFHLLPRQIRSGERTPRIISVLRNAKDTCVSYYHHSVLLEGYNGNFNDFCKLFLGDSLTFAPFWTNLLSYWKKRIQDNVLILKYEDMKRVSHPDPIEFPLLAYSISRNDVIQSIHARKEDLPSTIRKTAKFLDKNLTNDQVSALNEHLSFESMKKNSAVNNEDLVTFCKEFLGRNQNGSFIRTGTTDQWKSEMSPEVVKQFDDWSRHHLKDTNLSF